jgi:3',5'-cyclic AMP phosphodiesterase CpdA
MYEARLPIVATAIAVALFLSPTPYVRTDVASTGAAVIVAAGDIACPKGPCTKSIRTANLIGRIDPDAVLPLGDDQYNVGALSAFRTSYAPTWGRFRHRTFPVPGNHEYKTAGAAGYFAYFGPRTFGSNGWYSYDLGAWHLVALNSKSGGKPSSAQLSWLRADLAADTHRCQLAYWHTPRFSSGLDHGSDRRMGAFWQILQAAGVDVVLNGHEHHYERFDPLLPDGVPSARGIREFIAGTGGIGAGDGFRAVPLPGSEVRLNAIGVLRLDLHAARYDWAFKAMGGSVLDSGRAACH